MEYKETLKDVLNSNADSAYDRLKEIQYQGINVNLIPFCDWVDTCKTKGFSTILIPEITTLYPDGWERYTEFAKGKKEGPLLELYVAGHNTVYVYLLDFSELEKIESLMKED